MNLDNMFEKDGMYFYSVKGFASIKMELRFTMSNERADVIKARLLLMYLMKTNNKYTFYKDIRDKLKEFYNMYLNIDESKVGSKRFVIFTVKLLNPKLIDEDYFEDAIAFARDILFDPNFRDGKLDKDVFEQIKKDIINKKIINLANPKTKAQINLLIEALPKCNLNKNIIVDIEEFKTIVESITENDIIDFYNDLISNSFFRGFVFGDVNEEEFSIIRKYFPFKSSVTNLDYTDFVDVNIGEKELIDETIKDSTLNVVYQINNYSLDKWYLYRIIQVMLSNSNGLCHKVLRNERGLVYSAGSYINKYRFWGIIILGASISQYDKEKCLEGIREIFNLLKDEKVVNELLSFVKDKFNQDYLVRDELVNNLIDEVEYYVFNEMPLQEKLHNLTNSVTSQDIINEVSNIEEKFIYFYKGVKNEK